MEESKNKELSKKIIKEFYEGIDEPEYVRFELDFNELDPGVQIKKFYDSNDVLRKSVFKHKANKYFHALEIYNEDGYLIYQASLGKNAYDSIPSYNIYKYFYDGTEEERLVSYKTISIPIPI